MKMKKVSILGAHATDDYIMFTAFVWGYREGAGWWGSLLYTADYRVDKDGNNLIWLNAEYHF